MKYLLIGAGICLFLNSCGTSGATDEHPKTEQPNIIFFSLDDMNDWITPFAHAQAITPNMDRLAQMGTLFTNAHAAGVYCAPSRTALWTGLQASTTGCYGAEIYFYDYPDLVPMHKSFQQAGYKTYGAGKLFHHRFGHIDFRGWDEYFARNEWVRESGFEMGYRGDDLPRPSPDPYSPYKQTDLGASSNWTFLEWGPIPNEEAHRMPGALRTKWITDLLQKEHESPFFMGLGLYTPHYPNYAPQKYFDMYDVEEIELPEFNESVWDDLPEPVQRRLRNRVKIQQTLSEIGAYKEAVRAYLAAVTYADALLGEVLDALESSTYKDNTIVILWSDQGYHLGEKGHWGKHTLWRETSRIPFIFAGADIPKGQRVASTAGLIDIYPTLTELCGLPKQHDMDGISLGPFLQENAPNTDRDLLIPSNNRGGFTVVNSNYRLIHYEDGSEEFYDLQADPAENYNVIGQEQYSATIAQMRQSAPERFRESATNRNKLNWQWEGDIISWSSKVEGQDQPQLTL